MHLIVQAKTATHFFFIHTNKASLFPQESLKFSSKMKTKASQHNKFLRIITVPVRALSRARDFYVRSLTDYADRMNYGSAMPIPVTSQVTALPRSFSVSSARSHAEPGLVRASTTRSMGDRAELESYIKQQMKVPPVGPRPGPTGMPPRSTSVAMGRIDEDRPCCYFGEDSVSDSSFVNSKYSRSKSHAVTPRRLQAFWVWFWFWFFFLVAYFVKRIVLWFEWEKKCFFCLLNDVKWSPGDRGLSIGSKWPEFEFFFMTWILIKFMLLKLK